MAVRHASMTACTALLLSAVLAGAVSAEGARRPKGNHRISWADSEHRYGWVTPKQGYPCAAHDRIRAPYRLCATDDGGKHWHVILGAGAAFASYVRWSKGAGAVSKRQGEVFWTRDAARHWWPTPAFRLGGPDATFSVCYKSDCNRQPPSLSVGRNANGGRELRYWYQPEWRYRAVGWVPARSLACSGRWSRLSGARGTGPANVCRAGPAGGDGMTAEPLGSAARLDVVVEAAKGEGFVTSNPIGIDCGTSTLAEPPPYRRPACAVPFPQGSTVTLRGRTSDGSEVRWTGCARVYSAPSGYLACEVALAGDTTVTATFDAPGTAR